MSTTTISSEILALQLASQMIFAYGGLILIAFGTVGNILNIFVFIRFEPLRQMPNSTFLVTSFVFNLVQLWTARFSRSVLSLTSIDLLVVSEVYCKCRWVLGRASASIIMTCICLASIDRFLITSRKVRYHRLITVKRARLILVIVILINFVTFIPEAIFYAAPSCTSSGPFEYKQFVMYFGIIVSNVVPFLVLALFSTLTWRNLRTARLGQRNRLEAHVTRMMLAEFGMVCFTTVPNIVLSFYTLATQSMVKSKLRIVQDNMWSNVFNIINIATYCASFYIFFAMSRTFRQNVRVVLCCKRQNRITAQQTEPRNVLTAPI